MKNPVKNAEKWMTCPKIQTDHPGLAYVCPLDQLIVAQKLDPFHKVISQKGVGYTIFNNEGQKIFLAVQKEKCKKFNLMIFNWYGNEVIQIKKPYALLINSIRVWAPPGNFVGYVEQARCCRNTFLVKNRVGEEVLKIKAQSCCQGLYDVMSGDELVGQIKKEWSVEAVVGYRNFGVTFPIEMGVGDKAVLLGACFLIGYLKY